MRSAILLPTILAVVAVMALSFTAVAFGGIRMEDLNWRPSNEQTVDYTSGSWQLRSATINDRNLSPTSADHTVTLLFEDGQLRGSGACNDYQAFYGLEDDDIRVTSLTITAQDCEDPDQHELETSFLEALDRATRIDRSDDVLSLYGDQLILTFDATN